jgi:hypothetical protein
MKDLHAALVAERTNSLLTQARYDGLARLARCCTPGGIARGAGHVRAAGSATLAWLRKGQLTPYEPRCC